ncbi:MAG: hypothetical protein Q9169_002460 [Polycauliona sp. 2 TL-2023]
MRDGTNFAKMEESRKRRSSKGRSLPCRGRDEKVPAHSSPATLVATCAVDSKSDPGQYYGYTPSMEQSMSSRAMLLSSLPCAIALFPGRTGTIDESNEIHEPSQSSLSQRQQRQQPPSSLTSHPRPPPSSSSGSTRTLRRTPNFEQQGRLNQSPLGADSRLPPHYPGQQQPTRHPEEGVGGSTVSRNSRDSAFWPQRTNRISRRTAAAIIYALEDALRRPYSFTPITAEENASMADITSGAPPASNGRAQNGGSRTAGGAIPVPQNPSERVRTPTDIMRERRDREARKKAASEKQKEQEIAAQRRKQSEEAAAAGDAPGEVRTRDRTRRSSGGATGARHSGGENYPPDESGRRQKDRLSGGAATTLTPLSQPQVNTISGTSQVTQPSSALRDRAQSTSSVPQPAGSRRRTQTQGQAPPTQAPVTASGTRVVSEPQPRVRQTSTAAATNATQAKPSAAGTTTRPQNPQPSAPASGSQQRSTTTSSFPHAFERWETLSSHWEGLTSFWIRRLQQNSDEIDKNPLNSQLARQVNDLSAAGANLFHAVVELQRLRASSERKFQRWYFENEAFKEESKEIRKGLEDELHQERTAKAVAVAALTRVETDKNSAYQNRSTAEQMVKEMKRELQISKEEARRAWEELGRREHEERERTTLLRDGHPTLVGGLQVVPMVQGGAQSGQASTNRPSTREGPEGRYMPPPTTTRSGAESIESPIQGDLGYTTYDPARSDTDTDPFTEGGRVRTGQTTIPSMPTTIPQPQPTSNASAAALQAAQSAAAQQAATGSSGGGTYLRYGPSGTTAPHQQQSQGGQPSPSFYQHEGSSLLHESLAQQQTTAAVREASDDRSYVPSVPDTNSQDEYEMNSLGEIQRDDLGNPILYRGADDLGSEDTDEYDVQDQLDRERVHGQRYGSSSGIAGVEYGSGSTSGGQGGGGGGASQADYSGSGYGAVSGWEAVPRHHHPTRLSDVLEEDERTNRTSPSRASQR